jgi:hypothetical protein
MLPRMRVLLDFLTEWFREARTAGGIGHHKAAAAVPHIERESTAKVRLRVS